MLIKKVTGEVGLKKCLIFLGPVFIGLFAGGQVARASEFQLRAGYGLTSTNSLGATAEGLSVDTSAHGFSLAAFLTGPDNFLDFGIHFEQLTTPSSADALDVTFRRASFVVEKTIAWNSLFVSPSLAFGFLNTAHYKSGGQEILRASEPFTLSAGLGLGARFGWAGVLLESGYRWARLTQAIKSPTGDEAGLPFSPNWSSFYFRTSLLIWL